jgi:hypothetical protein
MKVLISCTENPKKFIEVLDELELLIDKKVNFDENKIYVSSPSVSKFCNPHTFFSFQPRHFFSSGLGFLILTWVLLFFRLPGQIPSGYELLAPLHF